MSLIVDNWLEEGRLWKQGDQSFQRLIQPEMRVTGRNALERWPSTGLLHPLGQSPEINSLCFSIPSVDGGIAAVTCSPEDSFWELICPVC